jgi:DNA-binding XRE family transcriptional regulator
MAYITDVYAILYHDDAVDWRRMRDTSSGRNCGMAQTLGERLKAVRRRLGMSQEELATRAGVAQDAIARVEQNKRQYMRSDELGRLAEALDAPADELLGIRDFKGV